MVEFDYRFLNYLRNEQSVIGKASNILDFIEF